MTEETGARRTRASGPSAAMDCAAIFGLAALTLVLFWKIVLTNQVLTGVDLLGYFYPYRDFASEALRAGRLPLWNPYLFMGAPLLANSQAAVLYPLHWPLLWLSAPKQIAWSIVLHVWIAGAGTYLLVRRAAHLGLLASLTAAIVFSFGGFLGAQVEHINQLNASAWMPWLLLALEGAAFCGAGKSRRTLSLLAGAAVVALILLAGHTQAAYIVLFGTGCYALLRGGLLSTGTAWRRVAGWLRGPAHLAAMVVIGLLLAAGQLLPTIELSQASVRSGGLEYREAVSFSLKPSELHRAFLPPLAWDPPFSEFVAYVGISGLLLALSGAIVSVRGLRRRKDPAWVTESRAGGTSSLALPSLVLAFLGVFMALGAYNPVYYLLYLSIPGIGLFRVPARWLLLYSLAMAFLSACGLDRILSSSRIRQPFRRIAASLLVLTLFAELAVSAQKLAYSSPTAPAAYHSMRSAVAHLLAQDTRGLFRFLSMSDIVYDPGDLGDMQAAFSSSLSQDALYELIVAAKMKEVLAYNLPLRYRLFSVDGYDGGLLPTARYAALESLFLPAEEIWSDGRLRQQLKEIPPTRLLSLLGVRYVITDKSQDAWSDGVYYDLEAQVPLGEVDLTGLPSYEMTEFGVVTYLTGAATLPTGTPVAQIAVDAGATTVLSATLRAGSETAEGRYDAGRVAHDKALAIHAWRDDPTGNDYLAVLPLGQPAVPSRIRIRSLLPRSSAAQVVLRGLSLIDSRTATSTSISISPSLRLVHSGDVKIYENLDALPRAFVVFETLSAAGDSEAVALMLDPGFDPATEVVLAYPSAEPAAPLRALSGGGASSVEVLAYQAERVELKASLARPGYLILTDAFYPGWEAAVDGSPALILRADLYFRAVALDAGEHSITFTYRPRTVQAGIAVGAVAWLGWLLAVAVSTLRAGLRRRNRV